MLSTGERRAGLNLGQHRAASTARGWTDEASPEAGKPHGGKVQPAEQPSEGCFVNWSEQVDRAAKRELVTSLNTVLKDTGLVVVAHYAGMTVAQTDRLPPARQRGWRQGQGGQKPAGEARAEGHFVRADRRSLQGADMRRLLEGSDRRSEGRRSRTPRGMRSLSFSAARWARRSSTRTPSKRSPNCHRWTS